MKIVVAACFHNRKDKTLRSTHQIYEILKDLDIRYSFVLVDDGSTDGTAQSLMAIDPTIHVVQGDGALFWAGGMRTAWDAICERRLDDAEFLLVFNDDIHLDKEATEKMLSDILQFPNAERKKIFVGSFIDEKSGDLTYGTWKRTNKFRPLSFKRVLPGSCDATTFNMNFVLIPTTIIKELGFLKSYFVHNDADFEFGLRVSKSGYEVVSSGVIGYCSRNPVTGTSNDLSLNFFERLRKLISVKEQPLRQRFLYSWDLSKFLFPVIFASPYLKLFLSKFIERFR